MAEEKQLSMAEVRKTIAASLGAAFGFIIALMWNNVVLGGLAAANIKLGATSTAGDWGGWAQGVVTAAVLTVVMIVSSSAKGAGGAKSSLRGALFSGPK